MNLEQSIMDLKGIGEKNAALFHKMNIFTVGDLLYHFPREYETYPKAGGIYESDSTAGKRAILARICEAPSVRRVRNLSVLKFLVEDCGGRRATVTYFNMPYLKNTIKPGRTYIFYGNTSQKNGAYFISQPKMYRISEYEKLEGILMPVYARTKGLTSQSIHKHCIEALTLTEDIEEYIPKDILSARDFGGLNQCLSMLHAPESLNEAVKARKRFSYEEFLLFLLAMKSQHNTNDSKGPQMIETADVPRLMESLPYQLTKSQKEAYNKIQEDMLGGKCMNRLLQGDVGCGKTIVALMALLLCVSNGYQGAMMAPTEVLAKQHMETVLSMTQKYNLPFKPVLLVGSQSAKEKRSLYEQIQSGLCNLVIGTHAIIQDNVTFHNLSLVITDEQHRFGVKQREKLVSKGNGGIHTIVMSATPIPRSLAMILYGDLDITEMKDMPDHRLPIKNCVVNQNYRQTAYKFMLDEIEKGHQVYIICPMAEPGIMEELENVVDYSRSLKGHFPQSVNIAYLHGKMKPKQKNDIMERFAEGQIDILVSTTVIEVGINVPNATVMLVENAERFGLATLHQIRGRVGRGRDQSYCIFMESEEKKKKNERLEILSHSNDGFEIASEDLKLRGPGDFMGIEQSGAFHFRFADIYTDVDMLKAAAVDAEKILKNDPLLLEESHIPLKQKLKTYLGSGYMNII